METNNTPALTKSQLNVLAKIGVSSALEAGEHAAHGEGCNTVGFYLSLHWKTASTAMDIGRILPSLRSINAR